MPNNYNHQAPALELPAMSLSGTRQLLHASVQHGKLFVRLQGEHNSKNNTMEVCLLPSAAHQLCTFITQNVPLNSWS